MRTEPTTVLREIYEIMNARDLDAVDHLYHPEVTLNGQSSSPAEIKAYCGALLDAFEDLSLTVEQIVADGAWVSARVVARGTHSSPLGELPATGKKVEISQHDLARIADGRVVECFTVFDRYGMLQQLGALPGSNGG
ncbi:MAG TPA: ester cyclase [Actinomycetota bacterium]|nr:ester cyclase [Actinomycetota bacterium]